jgi:hypothetical protein
MPVKFSARHGVFPLPKLRVGIMEKGSPQGSPFFEPRTAKLAADSLKLAAGSLAFLSFFSLVPLDRYFPSVNSRPT